MISDASAALFAVAQDDVEGTVQRTLARVRDFFDVDRCALLAVSADQERVTVRLAAYADGIAEVPPDLNLVPVFPWSYQTLLVERVPIRISRIEDLPPGADAEREAWAGLPIRSALTLPIESSGPIAHIIVLNTVHRECTWPDAFVNRLRVLGELLVGALDRQALIAGLSEAEAQVKLAVEAAGAGLWALDYRTGFFRASRRAREIFGYAPDEPINLLRLRASVHPEDWPSVRQAIRGPERVDGPVSVEYRIIRQDDGSERWIQSHGHFQSTVMGAPERLVGISIDITQRQRAQEALRTSEARLASGAELAGLAFYEVDFGEGVAYVDDRFRELSGLPPDREQGLQALEYWLAQLHPGDRRRVTEVREHLHDGTLDQISLEYRLIHPVHGARWIHHLARVAARDTAGRVVKSYGVLRDITEGKRKEDELRDLGRRLIRAHEEERALLARELHDDVTQRLAALAIDIGRAEQAAPDGPQAESMRTAGERVMRLSEDIHALAYNLHPAVLTELGLVSALQAECERSGRRSGLAISVDHDTVPPETDKEAALCLFRVAQEALNNVTRHARAGVARIALRQERDGLRLTVRDDGVGFEPWGEGAGGSLGLTSMRERVRLVRGTLDIESAPGRGTTVTTWVPLRGGST